MYEKNQLHSVLLCSCFHNHWSAGALLAGPLVSAKPGCQKKIRDSLILSTFQTLTCRCSEHKSLLLLTSFSPGLQQFICRWTGRCGCALPALLPGWTLKWWGWGHIVPRMELPTVPSLGREQSHHLPLRSPDLVQGRKVPEEGQRCLWAAIQPAQQAGKVIK